MNYKFQCDCCGCIEEGDDMTQTVLAMKHDKGCNAEIGAPWHAKCLFDWKFPNRPVESPRNF